VRLILDCEPEEMGSALTLFFRVISQNPNQEIGKGNAVMQNIGSNRFAVIRNIDSYTVRKMV
jgi:hypothetical protein